MTGTDLCLVILDHREDEFLVDLIESIERFCPMADVAWYDARTPSRKDDEPRLPNLPRLPCSRPLVYAKVTPFFIDLLEWQVTAGYEYVVNLESDMAFVQPGFERFLREALAGADHLAADLRPRVAPTSRWRPYRSLHAELPELMEILGVDTVQGCFSPGQAFTQRFAQAFCESALAAPLRAFVEANQRPEASFSLQEVLLPTLVSVLGLRTTSYPSAAERMNRYRPYHSAKAVRRAADDGDVHFVHPIRRDPDDAARQEVRRIAAVAA